MIINCSRRSFHTERNILCFEFAQPYCIAQRKDLHTPWKKSVRGTEAWVTVLSPSLFPTHPFETRADEGCTIDKQRLKRLSVTLQAGESRGSILTMDIIQKKPRPTFTLLILTRRAEIPD